jgi:GNAT superfamily N-acetyltransferase
MNTDAPAPFGWKRSAEAGLTFRPVTDDDRQFLSLVYASTRKHAHPAASMADLHKAALLLLLEFRAQQAHFEQHYPQADRLVVMRGDDYIGRLYIVRWPARHGIIDLTLLPVYRRRGAGEAMLRDLMDEAAAAGKDLVILVDKFSPAMRLYQRLGFVTEQDKGAVDLMRWRADAGEDA